MTSPQFGRSRRRVEDARFLTGAGRYVADFDAQGALFGWVLRAPHAHAVLRGIDAAAARAMPGVRLVLTGADLAAAGVGPLPCPVRLAEAAGFRPAPRPGLAIDRVRHAGEAVALVVADSEAAARDAAEAILVAYDPLPALVDPRAALAPAAPCVWDGAPGNRAFHFTQGDRAAAEAAFAAAPHQVALLVENQRVAAVPMEPRAAIARHDPASGGYELILNGQAVHGIRDHLAEALRIEPARLRLVAPDVGGGFGMKNAAFPEHVALLVAARILGQPVRWTASLGDDLLASAHGRGLSGQGRLGLDAAGRFRVLIAELVADLGAYAVGHGPGSSTTAFATAVGGAYRIPMVALDVTGAYTTTTPIEAYRGAGKPEANYLTERLVEAAARQLDMASEALRARNMIDAYPARSAMGLPIEDGRFAESLAEAVIRADRAGFAARRAGSAARGRLRGLGFGSFLETARGQPDEWAGLRVDPDGSVELRIGTQSNGQGHETSFPQLLADLLGVAPEACRLVQADTAQIPRGAGHGGARSLHLGGGAIVLAAAGLLDRARAVAAQLLQAPADTLGFAAGRFTAGDGGPGIDLAGIATAIARDPALATDGLAADALNRCDLRTFPGGTHVAEVEVDPETGEVALCRYLSVDDFGRVLNPALTASQVQGGVAQGIGQALTERIAHDPDSGQLLSASLMDYAIPRASDLPDLDWHFGAAPTEANPLGVKGAGQAGAIAAPQAVMAALLDALAPLGVRDLAMPATPARVWAAIRGARAARPGDAILR